MRAARSRITNGIFSNSASGAFGADSLRIFIFFHKSLIFNDLQTSDLGILRLPNVQDLFIIFLYIARFTNQNIVAFCLLLRLYTASQRHCVSASLCIIYYFAPKADVQPFPEVFVSFNCYHTNTLKQNMGCVKLFYNYFLFYFLL